MIDLLTLRAEESPHKSAYEFLTAGEETETLTFAELDQRARAIAARLQQRKAKGERVLLLFPPGIDYIVAFYGCLAAGAVAVPAYPPRLNRNLERLEGIIEDARPKIVLTTETVFRQMQSRFSESLQLTKLEWVIAREVPSSEADTWTNPDVIDETIAFLQYTSASTSKPKGVIVSHGNILHNQLLMKEAVQHNSETIAVSWLPLFHDMGLISVVLASLYNGMPCHLMSPVDFLKRPRLWLEAITRYRATFSGAPDFGFHFCVDKIKPEDREGLDLSSWTVAYNGSEPIRAETLRRFTDAFAPVGFKPKGLFSCYGLAEHTLFVTGSFYKGPVAFSRESLETHRPHKDDGPTATHLVSCGSPLLDTRVRIVDPQSCRPCLDGQIGEIWLQSPSVAQGYWKQPDITERDFRARLAGEDGYFFRTGDLGFTSDGELFITGRLKDLIIIHGRNLVPQDIEQVVERCDPAIRPNFVAAVSVDGNGCENLVIACEVRREVRRNLDTSALIDLIRSAVACEFEVSASAVVLLRPGTLPKTSSGKTQRAKVRQDFLTGHLTVIDQWRDEVVFAPPQRKARSNRRWTIDAVEKWIVERLATHLKVSSARIDRNQPLSHYGLDSVVVAAFVSELEETFGVAWDLDRLFESEPTIAKVAERVLHDASHTETQKNPTIPNVHLDHEVAVEKPLVSSLPLNGDKARRDHPFRTYVNPELARLLGQMAMDKSFVRGEGSWLWDENGQRYLDFLAQYGALPFGSNPSGIWEAINAVRVSGEPSFVQPSYLNAAGELAQRLIAVAPPGMQHVTFANSGAEAVEAAIKLCRSATGRNDILAASNGFHGKTLGALSATDKEKYQKPFGAPVAGFAYVEYGNIDALVQALSTERYAAFLVEPLQGEGGIIEPPAGYLRAARKACRAAGTLLVVDEIQTGIGRTGAMFACSDLKITPDVITVAKALGGGLIPIGACLSTADVFNAEFGLKHTSTFAGNTLACRAGIATLDLLEQNNCELIRQVAENGARLKEGLCDLQRRYPNLIAEVRGRGYLLGIRFGIDRYSVSDGLLGYLGESEGFTFLVVSYLLNFEGVRVGCTLNQGGIIRIEPPLTATWDQCVFFLRAFERVLQLLEQRDLATLTAQISGLRLPAPSSTTVTSSPKVKRCRPDISTDDGRFAFVLHPLAWKDYRNLDDSLSVLSENQLATLSSAIGDNFEPFVVGETRIACRGGKAAYGEFILVPRRAEELKAMARDEVVRDILEAVQLGHKRGAKIVGLGAFTSVVTDGGLSLKEPGLPALTTGNSYTAVAAQQTVQMAALERGWSLQRRTVAVVGASGAIGQALCMLLAPEVGRLILVGNPQHPEGSKRRLLQVAGRLSWSAEELCKLKIAAPGSIASWVAELDLIRSVTPDRSGLISLGEEVIYRTGAVVVSTDIAAVLPQADIVVCCTSSTERLIRHDLLRPNAVVCDVSRPSNVSEDLGVRRPDVLVLNGGVVRLPAGNSLGFNLSLPEGYVHACIAETMMLALDQRYRDTSLGFDLSLAEILRLKQLADDFDFRVALDKCESTRQQESRYISNVMIEQAQVQTMTT
jgi:acetylornithine/succinyldiaminopimelate/putrescine aminotransferase/acyl-CoA synthetase (AMP-forming)/AMP-acid ligase II/predicted amino acid dehydrogenase/acyl carrier protein